MKKQIVEVQYIYEGKSFPSENRNGVLLDGNKVFVSDNEGIGIYAIQPTNDPKIVVVNLDENDVDYLTDPTMIIDLIVA